MGGLRATNGIWKIVYIGVSLEMIQDTNIRKDMIHISHDWFHGFITDVDEVNAAFSGMFLGQNYPNPADQFTTIEYNGAEAGSVLSVYDMTGHLLMETILTQTDGRLYLKTASWEQGLYFYKVVTGESSQTKKFIVTH
jgi:hypothetical protein